MSDLPDRSRDPSRNPSGEDQLATRLPAEPEPGQLFILKILWAAFIATQGVFAVVYSLAGADMSGQDPEGAAAQLPIFIGLALLMTGGSLFAAPLFAAKAKLDYQVATLLRFAIAETIGIFGLILGFMGLETYPFAFLGVAALVILVQMPTATAYQRYRRECLSSVR